MAETQEKPRMGKGRLLEAVEKLVKEYPALSAYDVKLDRTWNLKDERHSINVTCDLSRRQHKILDSLITELLKTTVVPEIDTDTFKSSIKEKADCLDGKICLSSHYSTYCFKAFEDIKAQIQSFEFAKKIAQEQLEYDTYFSAQLSKLSEYLKSNEYAETIRYAHALTLAKSAGLRHDEHGGYSGDVHSISVIDIVDDKEKLDYMFCSGTMLCLAQEERTRYYSNEYTSMYGPGHRSDTYLVGTNETGTKFCHAVPREIDTVAKALSWIWNGRGIAGRQGDVAITIPKRKVGESGWTQVKDYQIIDSHYYTGSLKKIGKQIFVQDGILKHTKNQHPDLKTLGEATFEILVARRAHYVSSSSD